MPARISRQSGLTITELLISMVLGMFLISGLLKPGDVERLRGEVQIKPVHSR